MEKKKTSFTDTAPDETLVPLNEKRKAVKKSDSSEFVPPDGGWGWVVCVTSLLANGTAFSIINTFGIIYTFMVESPEYGANDPAVSFKTCKYTKHVLFISNGFTKFIDYYLL